MKEIATVPARLMRAIGGASKQVEPSGGSPLRAVDIERTIEGVLDGLTSAPMLVRATAREVISTHERYMVRLTLLRWRDEVVSHRHHVTQLIEASLQRSHPNVHVSIEGWWFAGDAAHPAGPIKVPGASDVPGMETTEMGSVEMNRFMPTLPPEGDQFADTVPNPLVDHEIVRLNF